MGNHFRGGDRRDVRFLCGAGNETESQSGIKEEDPYSLAAGTGPYSGIEYDAEILDGTFTHLAIVDNPRYPDGKILINNLTTKNKGVTMFFKLNKQNEEETKEQKVNEEDLIEEVQRLRMENAYLKKLQALVQKRTKPKQSKK